MLKVNFRHVSGFCASFTAHMFVGEKVSVMPNEKDSTVLFLFRLTYLSYPFHDAQISTG